MTLGPVADKTPWREPFRTQLWVLHDPSALGPATSKTHQKALGTAPNRIQYYNLFFFSYFFFHRVKKKYYYYIIFIVIFIINKFKKKIITLKEKP